MYTHQEPTHILWLDGRSDPMTQIRYPASSSFMKPFTNSLHLLLDPFPSTIEYDWIEVPL